MQQTASHLVDPRPAAALRIRVDARAAPVPEREATQLLAVRKLGDAFQQKLGKILGGRKWFVHFESWLWSSRASAMQSAAPVPVLCAKADDDELLRKLERAGLSSADARAACFQLADRASALGDGIQRGALGVGGGSVVELLPQAQSGLLALSCGGVDVVCSQQHLDKLRVLFQTARRARASVRRKRRHADEHDHRPDASNKLAKAVDRAVDTAFDTAAFRAHAFSTLARLHALQGGHEKAGGMQAACPPAVFDALRASLGVNAELFASPLNSRFTAFCSAAADVDAAFGSVGSFFGAKPRRGAYLANPPFVPAIVEAMARRMAKLLNIASRTGERLTFVVVLPHWPDKGCWRTLHASCCRQTVVIPQAEHGYMHGGQHWKSVLWQPSNHDSAVLILQSDAAVAATPLTPAAERDLRTAFRTPPPPSA
jgi:phosphorylated CTD-interacting factor 1